MAAAACGAVAELEGVMHRHLKQAPQLAAAFEKVQEPAAIGRAMLQLEPTCCHANSSQTAEAEPQGPSIVTATTTGTVSTESSAAGSGCGAALLPSLQHLEVSFSELNNIKCLLELTQAPQLTGLMIMEITVLDAGFGGGNSAHNNTAAAVQQVAEAMPRLLQQLPRLTVLDIPGLPITDAVAKQLGRMQGLRQISVSKVEHVRALDLQLLPSSITQLQLLGDTMNEGDPSMLPQMSQLTALLQLDLIWCAVPAVAIGTVPQLHKLSMEHCHLLPGNAFGGVDTVGTKALLAALAKLTALQQLALK